MPRSLPGTTSAPHLGRELSACPAPPWTPPGHPAPSPEQHQPCVSVRDAKTRPRRRSSRGAVSRSRGSRQTQRFAAAERGDLRAVPPAPGPPRRPSSPNALAHAPERASGSRCSSRAPRADVEHQRTGCHWLRREGATIAGAKASGGEPVTTGSGCARHSGSTARIGSDGAIRPCTAALRAREAPGRRPSRRAAAPARSGAGSSKGCRSPRTARRAARCTPARSGRWLVRMHGSNPRRQLIQRPRQGLPSACAVLGIGRHAPGGDARDARFRSKLLVRVARNDQLGLYPLLSEVGAEGTDGSRDAVDAREVHIRDEQHAHALADPARGARKQRSRRAHAQASDRPSSASAAPMAAPAITSEG